jgi:uncharacterized Zn-binding protein involved in type VI secretion
MRTLHLYAALAACVAASSIFLVGCGSKTAQTDANPVPQAASDGKPAATAAIAQPSTIPAAPIVSGKTYVTLAGDSIVFHGDGTATERNGKNVMAYAGQAINGVVRANGSNNLHTDCTYKQNGDMVILTYDRGAKVVFKVEIDGSLSGPPAGIWGQKAFAHLVLKK